MTKQQQISAIARRHLGITTLDERHSDRLDFHEVGVIGVAEALDAAYEVGRASATSPSAEADLVAALRENFTPHAVALIAAKLAPVFGKGEEGRQAEAACAWLAQRLINLLGASTYESLCEEMQT